MKKIMSISLALLLLLAGCTAQDKNTNTEKSTENRSSKLKSKKIMKRKTHMNALSLYLERS